MPVNARSFAVATAPETDDFALRCALSDYPASAPVDTLAAAHFVFLWRVKVVDDFYAKNVSDAHSVKTEGATRYCAIEKIGEGAISLMALGDLKFAFAATMLRPQRPLKLEKNRRSSSSYSGQHARTADCAF